VRIACVVEYDGSGFLGWQAQRRGRTVQQALERALGDVAAEPLSIVCAGRTDAGVHALGQVFHFDTDAERPAHAWLMGGNSQLPRDVALRWASPVDASFDARRSAYRRHYRYLLVEGADRPALWRDRAGWSAQRLDAEVMQRGAEHFLGEHDFSAFRAAACQSRTPMRRIESVQVRRSGAWITIDIAGNAFLHNMVRIMVGTLMAVGRGERPPEWVAELMAAGDRRRAGATARAEGLYFVGADYPPAFGLPSPDAPRAFPPAG
jgi:tRNA pseudouridine38-40 synthase